MAKLQDLIEQEDEWAALPRPSGVPRIEVTAPPANPVMAIAPGYGAAYADGSQGTGVTALDKLLGLGGQERFQLWPERMVRSALTLPGDVKSGAVTLPPIGMRREDVTDNPRPAGMTVSAQPQDEVFERVQDLTNLAMGGSIPFAKPGALGSGGGKPIYMVPALKYEGKIYKGKPGENHGMLLERNKIPFDAVDTPRLDEGFVDSKGNYLSRGEAQFQGWKDGSLMKGTPADSHNLIYPKGLKLRSGLGDEGKLPAAAPLGQIAKDAPTWYSPLENAVRTAKIEKATPDQWLGTINNMPGVKQEELAWLGVPEFLASKKGQQVSKQELQDYINSHRVEVNDVQKSDNGVGYWEIPVGEVNKWVAPGAQGWQVRAVDQPNNRPPRFLVYGPDGKKMGDYGNLESAQGAVSRLLNKDSAVAYSDYQLPGGTNYNELLLTLPARKDPVKEARYQDLIKKNDEKPLPENEMKELNEIIEEAGGYNSPHWDEPNVLAHVRFNDRTINGKKTLFLEEVQSDWHQAGRKKGYLPSERELAKKDPAIVAGVMEGLGNSKIPDAPFKKTWPELALKRMIRYAAENGYDAIAWTPGEVQAKRWSGTGEEGHKKFYDEILVNAANKLAKQHGGKVGIEKMNAGESVKKNSTYGSDGLPKKTADEIGIHYLELPESMRDTAMRRGMPLFSGGNILIPVPNKDEKTANQGKINKDEIEFRRDFNDAQPLTSTILPPRMQDYPPNSPRRRL